MRGASWREFEPWRKTLWRALMKVQSTRRPLSFETVYTLNRRDEAMRWHSVRWGAALL
jgi:hypothetical protein